MLHKAALQVRSRKLGTSDPAVGERPSCSLCGHVVAPYVGRGTEEVIRPRRALQPVTIFLLQNLSECCILAHIHPTPTLPPQPLADLLHRCWPLSRRRNSS